MKHTRPTITRIKQRIAELEEAKHFWSKAAVNATDSEDAATANHHIGLCLAAINELKALIGEQY